MNVSVEKENPPAFVSFVSVREHVDGNGRVTGAMAVENEGILTDIMASEQHKHLYKMTGMFVLRRGYNSPHSFSLVGMRVFSTHDDNATFTNVFS